MENDAKDLLQKALARRTFLMGAVATVGALSLQPILGSEAVAETGIKAGRNMIAAALPTEFTEANLNSVSHYISLRHVGPLQEVNETWAKLSQFAVQAGLTGAGMTSLAACPVCGTEDVVTPDPSESSRLKYDACLSISPADYPGVVELLRNQPADSPSAGIQVGTASLGSTMRIIHYGSYAAIGKTYAKAIAAGATLWTSIDGSGQPVSIEVYRNSPLLTKPESLVTEIHFPLTANYTSTGPLFH